MKSLKALSAAALLAVAPAGAAEYSVTNSVGLPIPDDNPAGLLSVIDVTGVEGYITNLSVSLNISGGWSGDFYTYVACDNGGFAVLLNRVGKTATEVLGFDDVGLNIVLNDQGAGDVHGAYAGGGVLTGTWQPDGRLTNPQNVLDTDPRPALLSSFNNLTPNGSWILFIEDAAGGDVGTLVEWSLTIQSIPEPSSLALALLGLGALVFARRRHSPRN